MQVHSPYRRDMLRSSVAVAMIGAAGLAPRNARAQQRQAVRWSSGTGTPRTAVPAYATDCHFHIYDASFPVAPYATLRPPEASVQDYQALQRRIGLTRCVLVQPSTYGTDNRAYLDLIPKLGRDRTRMVAVVNTEVTDPELRQMHDAGVRGIRFNLAQTGATTLEMLEPLSRRVDPMGWHCQINMPGIKIVEAQDTFLRVPGKLVFDHLAHAPQPAGVDSATFALIRRLLDQGNTWVKLSGAYADTKVGPPTYSDTSAVAKAYAKAAPERMVWGSDWPHPTEPADKKPDDAALFDLLAEWVPDAAARQRVLVGNPAELYDFPKS